MLPAFPPLPVPLDYLTQHATKQVPSPSLEAICLCLMARQDRPWPKGQLLGTLPKKVPHRGLAENWWEKHFI
jgi:hypothetical protein